MRAELDPRRAVQVIAKRKRGLTPGKDETANAVGSGYLVGRVHVLTAHHIVANATQVVIRFVPEPDRTCEVEGHVVWLSAEADIAVVEVPSTPGASDVQAATLGRLVSYARCESLGYPRFKLRRASHGGESVEVRLSHHAIGTATLWSNRKQGTLELTFPPPATPGPRDPSPWEGMSGAAVFSNDLLIAVVCEHHHSDGPGRLTASPVESWYRRLPPPELYHLRQLLGLPVLEDLRMTPEERTVIAMPFRDVSTFTGREVELQRLLTAVDQRSGGGILAIHTVDGLGGVGKTTLALRAANLLASRFPDGHSYLLLRAHSPVRPCLDANEALGKLLLSEGIAAAQIPNDPDARAELWRRRTAGRRRLLVLDDAASADQVRPLLPSAPESLVIITSRQRLLGLDGAVPLSLSVLKEEHAAQLFVRIANRPGLDPRDPAVLDVVRRCGYLPLAISMAAARLLHHPSQTPENLVKRLSAEGRRLRTLRERERSIAAAFDLSYNALDDGLQRFFRQLGASPALEIEAHAAAALSGMDPETAQELLDELDNYRLIDELATAPGRYRMHDLVHEHAAALSNDSPDESSSAVDRLLEFYVQTGWDASMDWLRVERGNLLACHAHAVSHRCDKVTLNLTRILEKVLIPDGPWADIVPLQKAALDAAHAHGDQVVLADTFYDLARAEERVQAHAAALDHYSQALEQYRELDDTEGRAVTLRSMSGSYFFTGHPTKAEASVRAALALSVELSDQSGQAAALNSLGSHKYLVGQYREAADNLEQALAIYRALGSEAGRASTLMTLGQVRWLTGDYIAAETHLKEALDSYTARGRRLGRCSALHGLGVVRRFLGDYSSATAMLKESLNIATDIGSPLSRANALGDLGTVKLREGNLEEAASLLGQSLALFRQADNHQGQAEALNHIGEITFKQGDPQRAYVHYQEALDHARSVTAPLDEADALEGLGEVALHTGRTTEGTNLLRQALSLYQSLGVPGAARVKARLGQLNDTQ